MSKLQVANIAFESAATTRIDADSPAGNIRITAAEANVFFANPTRTVFPTGTINVSNDMTVAGNFNIVGSITAGSGMTSAASQVEMEANTSTSVYVSPGRQHFHRGHPKVWLRATGAGVLSESYNMTSVTDTGAGDLDGTIATDFSSATWALIASIVTDDVDATTQFDNKLININAQAAGTFGLQSARWRLDSSSVGALNVTLSDPTAYNMTGFGDHA